MNTLHYITELSSSPGCCTLPAPGAGLPRPQTVSAWGGVAPWRSCRRMSRRPPVCSSELSSDHQMTSCSTGCSTSAATFCSLCFMTVELTVMRCEIGDMTFWLSCRLNSLTNSSFIDYFLKTLTGFHITLVFYFLTFVVFTCSIFACVRLLRYVRHRNKRL